MAVDLTPRVGISACFFHPDPEREIFKGKTLLYLEQSMAWWVQRGGGLPYLVPTLRPDGPVRLADYVNDLDGLLLHGGSDVCPRTYGEEPLRPEWEGDAIRDRYEIELVRAFHDAGKPVLGICRGHQIVNVAFGGTLWQDLIEQGVTDRSHRDYELYDQNRHRIEILPGTGLARLYPAQAKVEVNSIHHQAVREVGEGLVVEAVSVDDGVVEAVRLGDPDRYVVGVQWHPEFFEGVDDGTMLDNMPLLGEFLDRCRGIQAGDRGEQR
ncbi:MAG: gamma-glutamyl-gamma-aminobutyrate hydrolase family protein [Acidimicrobiales bacterium]|nr:gamma-glutamyl-gamma-aminobutyrate hydrolase family protein [Acidimicrobiales bacterium]